jgi:tetratricopeptide (TPR) repeat protein
MMEGKLREAIAQLEMGLALDARKGFERNSAIRSFFLAKAYTLSGDRNEALRHLDVIEELNVHPMYLKVFRNAALLAVENGDLDLAGRLLLRIEELDRRYPSDLSRGVAAQVRGEMQRAQGKLEEARASFDEARLSWDDPSTLRSLTLFWIEQGLCDRALPLIDQMLSARGRGLGDFFAPWADIIEIKHQAQQCSRR